jgi:hypothetical protein
MTQELTDFEKKHLESLKEEEEEELTKNSILIKSFIDFMKQKGIELNDANFRYYQKTGIVAEYPNLISYLNRNLIVDKEGLLNFDKLCDSYERKFFANGYLYSKNFMLMIDPYFRRSYHNENHFAPRFVDLFWNLKNDAILKYISLDRNRVRIDVDDSSCIELDTWFGAKFNKDIKLIPDGNVKLRPPMDLKDFYISFFFNDIYALDVKWKTNGVIKSFQAEEFKTEKVMVNQNGKEYHPVRYIHAEYDILESTFRHFDGAMHLYTSEEYYARRDSDFNYNFKNAAHIKTFSQKLFKMNGIIDIETWIQFSSHFLSGNPLMFEYFEGDYPEHIIDMLSAVSKGKE